MKKVDLIAFTKAEAVKQAEALGVKIVKEKTASWKNAGQPVAEEDFDAFAEKELTKEKLVERPDAGLLVTKVSGKANTRLRPYKFINVVSHGIAKKKLIYEICRADNDAPVGKAISKADAEALAKKLVTELATDVYARRIYTLDDDHSTAFRVEYDPSEGTRPGVYTVVSSK